MERSWEIKGTYATWRMAISVGPAKDDPEAELRFWREGDLDCLEKHFRECVLLWELYEEFERVSARRIR